MARCLSFRDGLKASCDLWSKCWPLFEVEACAYRKCELARKGRRKGKKTVVLKPLTARATGGGVGIVLNDVASSHQLVFIVQGSAG